MSLVKKTKSWWSGILLDSDKLNRWLIRLYKNEYDAYHRFNDFAIKYCEKHDEHWYLFKFLGSQELRHAGMVLDLMEARKVVMELYIEDSYVPTEVPQHYKPRPERYWDCVLPCIKDLSTAAGVGALAEGLSLERMRVIISDPNTPNDIRVLFEGIEPDEGVHAKVLGVLAGRHGISSVIDCHSAGLEALGLKLKGEN